MIPAERKERSKSLEFVIRSKKRGQKKKERR